MSTLLGGRYRLLRSIARGSTGEVFVAQDEADGMPRALKVMHPSLASDRWWVERFQREAVAAQRLRHPNIVEVLECGRDQRYLYLVMELLTGRDLEAVLRSGYKVSVRDAIAFTDATLQALEVAHRAGVLHRDIKPSNVFLWENERGDRGLKLIDFGLAKLAGSDAMLTRRGDVLGTPTYLSPEQATGAPVDPRADLYSVGCVLFELLTGSPPFTGTPFEVMLAQVQKPPPRLATLRPDLPASLDAIVAKALAKPPAQRYQRAADMLTALRAIDLG